MSDELVLQNVKKLIEACLSTGLIKTLPDAEGLGLLYKALEARLSVK